MRNYEEIWKPIPGYENAYQVSNQGRIRSIDRVVPTARGHRTIKAQLMQPRRNRKTGYFQVKLCKNNCSKTFTVHSLVAAVFLPRPIGTTQVNHLRGKENNSVQDLEWVTPSRNVQHAYDTQPLPKRNSHWVLHEEKNLACRSIKKAAELFQIPYSTLRKNLRKGSYRGCRYFTFLDLVE